MIENKTSTDHIEYVEQWRSQGAKGAMPPQTFGECFFSPLDVSRSERICRICDERVGDEIHFLFECPKLEDMRIKDMALGDRMRPNVYNSVHNVTGQ